jgi:O-antigen/teichoic acid export membrane protein
MNLRIEQIISRHIKRDVFLTNSFIFLLNTVAVSGLGFLFWWTSARLYSAYAIGEFVVVLSITQLITTIANMGLSYSLIRYLPTLPGENKVEVLNTSFTIVLLLTSVLSISTLSLARFFSPTLAGVNANSSLCFLFLFFSASLALYQIMSPILAVLRAGHLLLSISIITGISRVLLLILCSLKFNNLSMLMIAFALPTFLAFILLLTVLPNFLNGFSFSPRLNFGLLKSMSKYSTLSYAANVIHDLPYQLFPQFIAYQIGPASAAYFYMAWNFFNLITTAGNSFSLSMFVEGSHQAEKINRLARRNLLAVLIFTGIFASIIFILAKPLLLLYGSEYARHAIPLLRIMAIASIPAALVYSLIAALRVKMSLTPILTAFAMIATLSMAGCGLFHFNRLTDAGWVWGFSQLAALIFLCGYIRWKDLSTRRTPKGAQRESDF